MNHPNAQAENDNILTLIDNEAKEAYMLSRARKVGASLLITLGLVIPMKDTLRANVNGWAEGTREVVERVVDGTKEMILLSTDGKSNLEIPEDFINPSHSEGWRATQAWQRATESDVSSIHNPDTES